MMKCFAVLFLVVLSGAAIAQNDSSVLLKEVMVTATKNKQLSLLSPYSVSKLSTQQIQQFQTRTNSRFVCSKNQPRWGLPLCSFFNWQSEFVND
jgi:hypothetical protein